MERAEGAEGSGPDHAGHSHGSSNTGRVIDGALGLNGVLLIVQVAGAFVFGSLALIADSVHQGADVIALVVAASGHRLAGRGGGDSFTYGLKRVEIVGAQFNAVLLLGSGLWILIEALDRLGQPVELEAGGVIVLGVIGLIINGASATILAGHGHANLNARAAAVHLAVDAGGSAGVLASGLAVLWWDALWVDPVVSLILVAVVAGQAVRLMWATTRVLLEASPSASELERIHLLIRSHDGVVEVHHLHLWSLDSATTALTAHVVVEPSELHEAQELASALEQALADEGVEHATLALECHPCEPVPTDH
ncbi:MAG: cation transporter [Actinomycetia bacterium]|nr:cation transporter [Actinomycetes bacterium]